MTGRAASPAGFLESCRNPTWELARIVAAPVAASRPDGHAEPTVNTDREPGSRGVSEVDR
jgi:hypothetical protein